MGRHIRLDLPNGTIAADVHDGASAPVLLLHGIPGSRRTWGRVTEALDGCHLVVPDLLGFGDSGDPPGDFHAPGQAAALLDLLDALRVPAVHVGAFDFGGPVALELYRRVPHRVLSLTLAATNAFRDTPIPAPLRVARVPIAGDAVFALMCSAPGLAAMWVGAVADRAAYPWREHLAAMPSRRGRRWTRRVFVDSLRHLDSRYAATERTLRAISCPCVVVWGDRDPFFPVSIGERTSAAVRNAGFVLLRGCGHFIPNERPRELAGALRRAAFSSLPALRPRA